MFFCAALTAAVMVCKRRKDDKAIKEKIMDWTAAGREDDQYGMLRHQIGEEDL